jgi:hypothetical protein
MSDTDFLGYSPETNSETDVYPNPYLDTDIETDTSIEVDATEVETKPVKKKKAAATKTASTPASSEVPDAGKDVLSRTVIKKVFARLDALSKLNDNELILAAALYGVKNDVREVTAASLLGSVQKDSVKILQKFADTNSDIEATLLAVNLWQNETLKPAYQLALALLSQPITPLPSALDKAAKVATETIRSLGADQYLLLDNVLKAVA